MGPSESSSREDDSSYMSQVKRKVRRYLKMPRSLKSLSLYLLAFLSLYVIIDISGVFRHPLERDYYTEFSYPLDIPNFPEVVARFRQGEPVGYDPINLNYSTLKFLSTAGAGQGGQGGCIGPLRLLILVKSALPNLKNREVIRQTWGYPRRFSDVAIKTVFLLGQQKDPEERIVTENDYTVLLETRLEEEIQKYDDIVRGNFTDSYYNNTMKTMMGMRWANEFCSNFRFIFFVDDDMYVSVKNLLKFVRNPTQYPEYWEEQRKNAPYQGSEKGGSPVLSKKEHSDEVHPGSKSLAKLNSLINISEKLDKLPHSRAAGHPKLKNSPTDFDIDLDEGAKLYAGYVFFVPPHRHKVGTKWFLPLSEYPFTYFPPYVPAGAIIMSKGAFLDIFYASFFTKHFRFDDIFVALCAKKMGIEPYHTNYFRFWPAPIRDPYEKDFKYVITSHGFDDPEELRRFWNVEKSLGQA